MIEERLGAVLDRDLTRPGHGCDAARLVDRIAARERLLRRLEAAQQVDLVGFDTTRRETDRRDPQVGPRLVGRTVGTEVGLALGISPTAAAFRVAFARSIVDHHPALQAIAAAGGVSSWALRLIGTATAVLDDTQQAAVAAQLAADITARAAAGLKQYTPYELAQAAAARVLAADPDAAMRRCQRARADRRVSLTDQHDGAAALWAHGPAEASLAMYDALEHTARARRDDGDDRPLGDLMYATLFESILGPAPDTEPADQTDSAAGTGTGTEVGEVGDPGTAERIGAPRAAGNRDRDDAGELSQHDLDPDDTALDTYPTHPADPPTGSHCSSGAGSTVGGVRWGRRSRWSPYRVEVQVVMSAATLLGYDNNPALLRGYGAIPADLAHHIATATDTDTATATGAGANGVDGADALDQNSRLLLRRLFCDPSDGRLLTMETTARYYTGALACFAHWRDQHCRLSSGQIRDKDHIKAVTDDGDTTGANVQGLTRNSHTLKDHPGIHVTTRSGSDPPEGAGDSNNDRGSRGGNDPPDSTSDRDSTGDRDSAGFWARLRAHAPDITWTMPTGHPYRSAPPPALGHGSHPHPIDMPAPKPPAAAALTDEQLHTQISRVIAAAPTTRRRAAKRRRHQIHCQTRGRERNRQRDYQHALSHAYRDGYYTHHQIGTINVYPKTIPGLTYAGHGTGND